MTRTLSLLPDSAALWMEVVSLPHDMVNHPPGANPTFLETTPEQEEKLALNLDHKKSSSAPARSITLDFWDWQQPQSIELLLSHHKMKEALTKLKCISLGC